MTPEQKRRLKREIRLGLALLEVIRERGPIGQGHLFALGGGRVERGDFDRAIRRLERLGLVRVEGEIVEVDPYYQEDPGFPYGLPE